jgi:3-deoxy-manno-octulosonate cytidylyltransferase (CMP-KDO synthetase)
VKPSAAIILPVRFYSSRFPGKPLAVIAGHPLVAWVYRRACDVPGVSRVVVATDHDDIARVVRGFGGDVVMTTGDYATGTDRVAAVAREMDDDIIVNLQGDEPVFPPVLVAEMIDVLRDSLQAGDRAPRVPLAPNLPPIDIVTACHPITNADDIANTNVVKVVTGASGRALYFSRSAIPHAIDGSAQYHRHIGIYVFRRESLLRFTELAPSPLEKAENLEQLRALENGMSIAVVRTDYTTVGVDVPEDIKSVEKALGTTYSL